MHYGRLRFGSQSQITFGDHLDRPYSLNIHLFLPKMKAKLLRYAPLKFRTQKTPPTGIILGKHSFLLLRSNLIA